MRSRTGCRVAAVGVLLLFAQSSGAAAVSDPALGNFVRELVAAINRGDAAARRALVHPAALRCPGLRWEGARATPPIPARHRWRIEPLAAGSRGLFAERFDYPVRPTHLLHIDYSRAPNQTESLLLQLVRDPRGRWYEVTGCPNRMTQEAAERAAPQRAAQEARIGVVAAQLAPALKNEVRRLIATGRKVDAILRVREATGEDLAVAKGVVERLTADSSAAQEP